MASDDDDVVIVSVSDSSSPSPLKRARGAPEPADAPARTASMIRADLRAGAKAEKAAAVARAKASKALDLAHAKAGAGRFSSAEIALVPTAALHARPALASAIGNVCSAPGGGAGASSAGCASLSSTTTTSAAPVFAPFLLPAAPWADASSGGGEPRVRGLPVAILRFARGTIRPRTAADGGGSSGGGGSGGGGAVFPVPPVLKSVKVDLVADFRAAQREPVAAVVLSGDEWLTLAAGGAAGVVEWVRGVKRALAGSRVLLLVHTLAAAVRAAFAARRNAPSSGALTALAAHLFVCTGVGPSYFLDEKSLAEHVARTARAIATRPYTREATALSVVGKASKESTTWERMLQMVPGVSDSVAKAVSRRFPTFRSLMDAYAAGGSAALLEDVLLDDGDAESDGGAGAAGGGKRKLSKVSADIFAFFTATDGDSSIGGKAKR